MKKLYLLTTIGMGQYYVIAENPSEAECALISTFEKQDYGFYEKRKVKNIEIVAESFVPDYRNKEIPNLSGNEKLLIVDDWFKK
jgi:hypothetical protein